MAKTTFTRKEFFDLVWSEPLAALSRKYNISYTCIREVCVEMGFSIPPNGYWSKLKFGKPVSKDNFWESEKAKQEITLWLRTDIDGEEYFSKDSAALIKNKAEISSKLKAIESKKNKFHVEDPLITMTKEYYNQKDHKKWDYSKRSNTFDITVSSALLKRTLKLMEQFINTMIACGHSVIIKSGKTFAVISDVELQISIAEKSNRINYKEGTWNSSRLVYNGKLCLKYYYLYPQREWVDSTTLLEDKLLDIIAKLEVIAHNEKTEKEEREKYWEEKRIKEQKEKDLQTLKEKELHDFKLIFKFSKRYKKANDLRNFIDTFEKNAIEKNALTNELNNWIEWVRKKADWYDPFIGAEDDLLCDVDKDSLTFRNKSRG